MTKSTTSSTKMSMNVVGLIMATGMIILFSPLIPVALLGYLLLKLKPKVQK